MDIAKFSVKNSVLVNLMMIGLFVFGTISLLRMPTELNPDIDFNWVFVQVNYPGAAPAETEALIVDPIEAEIKDLDKISEIQSNAGEGFGFVMVKFDDMSENEFREKFTDLKAEIDKVSLPDDADDPIIDSFGSGDFMPVITINMSFTIPEANAQYIADDLEDDIGDLPGVAKVQVSGLAQREIWVEVDPEKMNTYGITFDQIVMALKMRNLNIPGGNISFGKTEYLIRSLGEYSSIDEIANTIIKMSGNGDYVKLSDVAKVNNTREEMPILSRINGEQSITFSVSKTSEANSMDVIDDIKALMDSYREKVPDGVIFSYANDNSIYIMRVINVLRNNAILGMILIIFVLYFFLGFSNAALAALGIPISFFITFIFMQLTGNSLNGSTLFALVMVLGIIVDDAIIVIENCHRYRLKGFNSLEAAVKGTTEVIKPILSSIGTNIAAFLPLMLIGGLMGKFLRIIPIVFSLALIASLFEAFFLLPSHYADWTVKSKTYKKGEKKFFKNLRRQYTKLLFKILRWRWLVTGILIAVLFIFVPISIYMLGVEMFGDEDMDQFRVLIKLPEGTSLDETNRIVQKFEQKATELPEDDIGVYIANVGLMQGNNEWLTRKNVAQIIFQLEPVEERENTTEELLEMMREKTSTISGPTSVEFELISGGPPVGKPISVRVQGKFLNEIKQASLALQDSLHNIKGTKDITDDYPPGKKEIRIKVDQEKAAMYGFTTQYVAMNVRSAFDGITATEYREGDDEIDVIVKYDQKNRSSMNDVLFFNLTNATGQTVPVREMVDFELKSGPDEIKRFNQKRTIMVIGNIDEDITTLDVVNNNLKALFPRMEEQFPGIHFEIGGQFEEFTNIFGEIGSLFVLSLILIFLILGTQFNSYSQPLVILTTVPFALIGAILGLIISNNPFSIIAMYGFVALAGIVVNDAIVLIDFINNRRPIDQMNVHRYWSSIVEAGRLRLRPIILTSLTTISGLVPMAFGLGGTSETWAPLANVILFGLLVSTILTLFIVPSFMAILDDLKRSRYKISLR